MNIKTLLFGIVCLVAVAALVVWGLVPAVMSAAAGGADVDVVRENARLKAELATVQEHRNMAMTALGELTDERDKMQTELDDLRVRANMMEARLKEAESAEEPRGAVDESQQ
ncbi:MAG: hypothetical protein QF805_30965 [Pirellulaceae bacterium]|nr:hypothetical protein [Pirellulaceae bacterium]